MKNKLSLKHKILFGYIAITIILIALAAWSINNFMSLNDSIHDIMVENYRSVIASEGMMEALERQDSAELMFLFGQQEEAMEIFQNNQIEFTKHLSRAEDNITIDEENQIIENINSDYQVYLDKFMTLRDLSNGDDFAEMQEYYLTDIMPHFQKIKEETRSLLMVNQEFMRSAQKKANDRATQAIYSSILFSIAAIILAITLGIYISNKILKPINSLTDTIKDIAGGNLEKKIDIKTHDEIGVLAEEFNSMTERLKEYEKLNISKLIEEKNKSEGIVKSISNPLIVTDNENKVLLINPDAEKLFNLKEREISGTHFLEIIKEEEIFEAINETLETGKEIKGQKNRVVKFTFDNKDHYYRITTNPVEDKLGETSLVVTILEDITHLKEVDRMKSEFVSMVSHEFRTPLTSMNMSINMLLEESSGEINQDQRELLEVAKEDTEHLNNLVDDLLDLSKLESGKIDLDFENVLVNDIFESSVKPFEQKAEEKGIELVKEDVNSLKVYADSNKITWVITNLIGNALRYTNEGDKIMLDADKKGHKVHISVSDTGEGIPKEYQHKVFEKFVRAGNDQDESTGTGLGLPIAKEIVEAHGGRIWVKSKEGEGSTFTFSLKLPK
ncbi:MAG: ATP-binding protein [Bacillota bacterium]